MEYHSRRKSFKELLKNKKFLIGISIAAAALLILTVVLILSLRGSKAVTRVSMDVNPGIELSLDKHQKVREVSAVNPEGKAIVEGLTGKVKGELVYTVLENLVLGLSEGGYFAEKDTEMLIGICDDYDERAEQLERYIIADLKKLFEEKELHISLLTQTFEPEKEVESLTETYSITCGKAALLEEILEEDATLDAVSLLELPLGDLKALSEVDHPGVPVGREAAYQAVIAYALGEDQTLSEQLTCEITFSPEKSPAIYTVRLSSLTDSTVVDIYTVDAYTGEVLSGRQADEAAEAVDIGQDAAKEAALKKVGLTEAQVTDLNIEKDIEEGDETDPSDDIAVYKISFVKDDTKHEFTVSSIDASVLEYEVEKIESATESEKATESETASTETEKESESAAKKSTDIGVNAATAAALKKAGCSESQVSALSAKRDTQNGKTVYKVEFKKGNTEYEITVDAATGNILKTETEVESEQKPADIGISAAKEAALKEAKCSADSVSQMTAQSYSVDGKAAYLVSFVSGNEKYTVVISASDGTKISIKSETVASSETETETEPESESESQSESETSSTESAE